MQPSSKKPVSSFMVVLAFATVYIVWGSTYFFILKAMDNGFPPFLLGAIRFITAGVILMAISVANGEKIFIKTNIKHAVVSGLLLLFVGNGIVIWVEQYLPSTMVAITVSAAPIWFVLLDKANWQENFSNRSTLTGLMIGFVGVILLFSEKIMSAFSSTGNHSQLGSMGLLIIGSVAWCAGSLYSKYKSTTGATSVNIAWQMVAAGIAFIPGAIITGEAQHMHWQYISIGAWLSLFYLVFFGSIAAFSAYVWLLKVRSPTQVSTYAYVNPVVAVLLGVFFAHENISAMQVAGLLIILGSVLLINLAKYRKQHITAAQGNQAGTMLQKATQV